ncbi:hypothetical protein DL95DRAFT_412089 [Leptodontidium sp. 2 PMI_412]|nr:hypothetical protein DL95DRAFT_412089 [Leptodontidium sp. 2 PMI_412]
METSPPVNRNITDFPQKIQRVSNSKSSIAILELDSNLLAQQHEMRTYFILLQEHVLSASKEWLQLSYHNLFFDVEITEYTYHSIQCPTPQSLEGTYAHWQQQLVALALTSAKTPEFNYHPTTSPSTSPAQAQNAQKIDYNKVHFWIPAASHKQLPPLWLIVEQPLF